MKNKRNESNPKAFWKMLQKLSPKKKFDSAQISSNIFSEYFKKLLNTSKPGDLPPDDEDAGPLDHCINLEEVKKAASILKPGKAMGIDNISNEMIMCLVENHPKIIVKLFNSIYIGVMRDNSGMDNRSYCPNTQKR